MLHTRALRDDMLCGNADLLVIGIVLVDGEGCIVHANRAGMRRIDEARAVRRYRGRLTATDPDAALALRVAIAQATRGGRQRFAGTGIAMPVPDADAPESI